MTLAPKIIPPIRRRLPPDFAKYEGNAREVETTECRLKNLLPGGAHRHEQNRSYHTHLEISIRGTFETKGKTVR